MDLNRLTNTLRAVRYGKRVDKMESFTGPRFNQPKRVPKELPCPAEYKSIHRLTCQCEVCHPELYDGKARLSKSAILADMKQSSPSSGKASWGNPGQGLRDIALIQSSNKREWSPRATAACQRHVSPSGVPQSTSSYPNMAYRASNQAIQINPGDSPFLTVGKPIHPPLSPRG